MTVVNPDSIAGITSVTSSGTTLEFYDVNGNLLDVSANLTGQLTVGTGATINSPATNAIDFETNGAERLRIDSGGRVGINTVTPYTHSLLHVGGTGANTVAIGAGGQTQHLYLGSNQIQSTLLGTAHSKLLLNPSGGNIGIGTDDAGRALTIRNAEPRIRLIDDDTGSFSEVYTDNSGHLYLSADAGQSNGGSRILFNVDGAEKVRITADGDVTIGNSSVAFPSGGGLQVYNASAPRIKLTNSTTGVASGDGFQIYVSGSGAYLDQKENAEMRFYTNALERLRITSAGRVGINETSPDTMLHVRNDNSAAAKIGGQGGAEYYMEIGQLASNGSPGFNATGSSASMLFQLNGSEKLRITSTGIVQINQGTAGGNHFKIINDEISLLAGVNGTGDTYAREAFFGSTRVDSGSLPFLRVAGQGGIKFCVDANSERVRIDTSGRLRVGNTTESADSAFDDLIVGSHSGNRGITILSTNGQQGALGFAKSGTNADGYLAYVHNSTATSSAMTIKSSGTIQFNAGSVERVHINSLGEMSIGGQRATAYDPNSYGNPSLLIAGDDNADILTIMNDDPSPNNGDYASLGFRVAGQSTGSYAKAAIIVERNGGYNALDFLFCCGTDADATRTTTSHEKLRIKSNGDLQFGENPDDTLWDAGDTNGWYYRRAQGSIASATKSTTGYSSYYVNKNTGSGTSDYRWFDFYWDNTQRGRISYNGSGGTSYGTSSDYRLKENAVLITDGIAKVKQLKPYRFNFKSESADKVVQGFFAHEAQEIVPYTATGTKDEVVTQAAFDEGSQPEQKAVGDPIYQDLDYAKFTPILTAALKEAIAKIESIEAKVESIEAQQANDAAYEAKIDKIIDYFKL